LKQFAAEQPGTAYDQQKPNSLGNSRQMRNACRGSS
jgi:hypothetical protein